MDKIVKENKLSSLEIYINKVFKRLIVGIPSITLCAGLTFTILMLLGYYPTLKPITIGLFDATCIIYTAIGVIFYFKCESEKGVLKPRVLLWGKIFIAVLIFIQWNFITYMIPSRNFWAYSFFFVLVGMFFLDSKYLLIVIGEVVISMIASWIARPDVLLPVRDQYFVSEIVLRAVLIVLFMAVLYVLTLSVEKRLAAELERISDTDTLTGLYNRRKLTKILNKGIVTRKRNNCYSVVMLDIDDFKKINDTYGHPFGDVVLKDLATILKEETKDKGVAFRYGGEEFLLLLYCCIDEAYQIAEDIRKKVAEHQTECEGHIINITITLGVASSGNGGTYESILKRADDNLYYGKKHNKNCVIK